MAGFDPTLCAYVAPGGQTVRLAAQAASTANVAPVVALSSVTVGRVTTVTATVTGNTAAADLSRATWTVTPTPAPYAGQTFTGPTAVFSHGTAAAGASTVTVQVPRVDGGADVNVAASITYATVAVAPTTTRTWTRGGEVVPVAASFGFAAPRPGTDVRLVRTASPAAPTEATLIEARHVNFTAGAAQTFTANVAFPTVPGVGGGYEYRWETDMGGGHTIRSGPLPVWVIGTDPTCAPTDIAAAPTALPYPSVYVRAATDSGTVTPASGKTYAQHAAKVAADWKATNLPTPLGGAWIGYDDNPANLYWVNLDDTSIPRYTITYDDTSQAGPAPAGWYGTATATPFTRTRVAVDVPIPNNATPTPARALTIVGMRAGAVETIWELSGAVKRATGAWQADTVAATTPADEWRHSRGYTPTPSGLSPVAYTLRVAEAKAAVEYVRARRAAGQAVVDSELIARVPHALGVSMPAPAAGSISYPATGTDGTGPVDAVWEGQLFYLRQDADITARNLSPLQHVIAVVGKYRGFRCVARSGNSTILSVESDQAYGGNVWATIREPGETWKVTYPDDWFIPARQYPSKAAFDADTDTGIPSSTFVDAENVTFTNGSLSSRYHVYAAGRSSASGLLFWLHGDAAYEFNNPNSTYVMGSTNGVKAVGKNRGYIVVNVLTPDTSGTVTWWENGQANAVWFAALLDALVAKYGVSRSKVVLCGFSGGAQFITQTFLPSYSNKLAGGGSIVFGGGGRPINPSNPSFSAAFKQAWWAYWATGALDDAAHSDEGYDALGYAKAGAAWYRNAGFVTGTNWIPGATHELDGTFGGLVAGVLDNPPKSASPPGAAQPGAQATAPPAAAIYVATTGSDTAAGTLQSPYATLGKAFAVVPDGGTIVLRGGNHHAGKQVPASGYTTGLVWPGVTGDAADVTLMGYPGEPAWLDGSTPHTGWTQNGAVWEKPIVTVTDRSPTGTYGADDNTAAGWAYINAAHPRAHWPERVWIDGVEQTQVPDRASVTAGTFAVEGSSSGAGGKLFTSTRYVLGTDPSGREVRVADLAVCLSSPGPRFTMRGVGVRRYATSVPQRGAVKLRHPACLMRDVTIEDVSTIGLTLYQAPGTTLQNCTIRRVGMLGIDGFQNDDTTITRCEFSDCNRQRFNRSPESGCVKVTSSRRVNVIGNTLRDSACTAVWMDESVAKSVIARNLIANVTGVGVHVEISGTSVITGNVVDRAGADGILIQNVSGAVRVWNNTVTRYAQAGKGYGVSICGDARAPLNAGSVGLDSRFGFPHPDGITGLTVDVEVRNNVVGPVTGSGNAFWSVQDYTSSSKRAWTQFGLKSGSNLYGRKASAPSWPWILERSGTADPEIVFDLSGLTAKGLDGGSAVKTDDDMADASGDLTPGAVAALPAGAALPTDIAALLGAAAGATDVVGAPTP